MLEQLRGRNLAHVGCTLGLTLGLILGMVAAIVIIVLYQAASAADWATFAFFAVTFGLGALGFYLGGRVSRRLWGTNGRPE
jgi:fucose permease